jgi:hypothetical protein
MDITSISDIVTGLQKAKTELVIFCEATNENTFFQQPVDKWSIAQNIHHLTTSARITLLAYNLPKLIVRIYGGKPNRSSRSYDELVTKYKLKLQAGGRASGVFIPKPISASYTKQKTMNGFIKKMDSLINAIQRNWNDAQLDNYIIPHPLLGKITLRELGYFTIYHTYHHLEIISARANQG